ncbi:MAG: hypothetical protein ACTFAL_00280 [Candidatus Electronema sp. V4]|uniref:hypothetical protein n=1 Tax=Candidatus Electronema sp. V4 TaxID=3454756 RepID=UPI00405555B1
MTWPPNSSDVGDAFSILVQSVGEVLMTSVVSVLLIFFFIRSFPSIFKFFVDNFILKVHENKYENGRLVAVRVSGRNGNPDRWVEVNEDGTRLEKKRSSGFSQQKSVTADFRPAANTANSQRSRVKSYEVDYYSSGRGRSDAASDASSSVNFEGRALEREDYAAFRSSSGRRSSPATSDFGPPPSDYDYVPPSDDYDYY